MRNFFREFKDFISKGNVIDLAVAVVIGTAFNAIISSLVGNIIMPLASLITGGASVHDWKWVITPADAALGVSETALYYGLFIQAVIDFFIIALSVFLALKMIGKLRSKLESTLDAKERRHMKELNLDPRNKQDVITYKKRLSEKSSLSAVSASEDAQELTEVDLLKEIRDLLSRG